MAAKGLITFHELQAKITALEETRETAQRKLEALNRRHEKVEELKRDRNTLLDSLVATAPEALDALTPEGRLKIYGILGLRAVVRSDGGVKASGLFENNLSVCTRTTDPWAVLLNCG